MTQIIDIVIEGSKSYGDPDMIVNGKKMDADDFVKNYGDDDREINKKYDIFLRRNGEWSDKNKVEVVINRSWGKLDISFR